MKKAKEAKEKEKKKEEEDRKMRKELRTRRGFNLEKMRKLKAEGKLV